MTAQPPSPTPGNADADGDADAACTRTVQITNRRGLHARASAKFVTLASQQAATVTVEKDGSRVTGTSIMGLMMLGAAMGDSVTVSACGTDAQRSLDLLVALVEGKFGED